MSKIRIAIITSIVLVVLFFSVILLAFFNNTQINNNQTPTPTTKLFNKANITNFYFDKFFPAEGLSWHCGFVIEITNNETQKVDGLTLTFNTQSPYNLNRTVGFYNSTYPSNRTTILPQKYVEMGQPCLLGSLEQGETKILHGYIQNNFDDSFRVRGYDFDVSLRINFDVLDQETIMIPGP